MASNKRKVLSIGALLLSSTTIARGAEMATKSRGGEAMVVGMESSAGGDHTALMGKIFPVVSQLFRRR
jgi:hypothetical protein